MDIAQVAAILARITYKDWTWHVEGHHLQLCFTAEDATHPGERYLAHGRKFVWSRHMTKSEIVQTALMAVLAAEEHEAREHFRYQGRAVFGPHFDVDQLVELCCRDCLDTRPDATTRPCVTD